MYNIKKVARTATFFMQLIGLLSTCLLKREPGIHSYRQGERVCQIMGRAFPESLFSCDAYFTDGKYKGLPGLAVKQRNKEHEYDDYTTLKKAPEE